MQQQVLPLARACEVMQDLLGVWMSEGTLCDRISRCAQTLTDVEQQVKQALIQAEVLHQDETGWYVAGKCQWVHVTCTLQAHSLPGACQPKPQSLAGHWDLASFPGHLGP